MTVASDQIDRIVWNQHQDPFEVLGPHQIEHNGSATWVVRAYLPNADAAWIIRPDSNEELVMESVHNPHFFECQLKGEDITNYQIRVKEGDIYDCK